MLHANRYIPLADQFPGRLFNHPSARPEVMGSFQRVRENGKRCLLEIGSGSGTHLIEQARRNPESNLFGIELRYKRSVRTIEKSPDLKNLFVLRDHAHLLRKFFPERSVSGIWVNFPDPWDKRKTNRILRPESLREAMKTLCPGGVFSFKTDHLEFFESVLGQLINESLGVLEQVIYDLHSSPERPGDNVVTEFESLFMRQGLPVYYLRTKAVE